jgi:hypothetical protein
VLYCRHQSIVLLRREEALYIPWYKTLVLYKWEMPELYWYTVTSQLNDLEGLTEESRTTCIPLMMDRVWRARNLPGQLDNVFVNGSIYCKGWPSKHSYWL